MVERFVRVRAGVDFSAEMTEGEVVLRVLRRVSVLESARLRFIARREDRSDDRRFSVTTGIAGQGRVSLGPRTISCKLWNKVCRNA